MAIAIRKCTIDDLDALRNLSEKTYDDTFRAYNTAENMDVYLKSAFNTERIRSELMNLQSEFYFLSVDDILAGYLKLNETDAQSELHDPEALEVERIYIATEFLSKGLGQLLLEKAIQRANELHKVYLWLGVWEHNAKAIAFYERNGFYRVGQHAFFMGDDEQLDYILRKDL